MTDKKKIILGISCGDINGVGLEVLIKAFSNNTLFDFCTPILYAPISAVNYYKKLYKWQDCNYHVIRNPKNASPKQLNIININESDIAVKPGENTLLAGKIAITSIDLAISDLKKNSIDVIVTLPVNKQNISLIDKNFIGHTEHFSKAYSNTPNLMLLCNDNLKIATATNHIPISKVSDSISSSLLEEKIFSISSERLTTHELFIYGIGASVTSSSIGSGVGSVSGSGSGSGSGKIDCSAEVDESKMVGSLES